jgi:predicted  nucleic acid-binding Zn-ribbon protein
MTNNGSSSRLDRIEALIESNARAIQALTEDLATFKLTVEQDHAEAKADREEAKAERQELRQATIGIANLLSSLDSDRPTILRKLSNIENKLDELLETDDD